MDEENNSAVARNDVKSNLCKVYELVKDREDYLVKQEAQSVELSERLIGLAGISALPTLFGEISKSVIPKIVLFTIGMTLLVIAGGIGCVDLFRARTMNVINPQKFRDLAYEAENEEEFLLSLIDQRVGNLDARQKAQNARIILSKVGYASYAVSIIFIVIAFAI